MRLLLACLLLAVGCGASSKVTVAPDGRWRATGAVAQSLGSVAYAVPTTTVMVIRCMDSLGGEPTN